MLSDDEISPSDAVAWKSVFLAAFTCAYYDYLITLDREVEQVWTAKKSAVFTFLWLIVRYVPLIAFFVVLLSLFGMWPSQTCSRFAGVPTLFLMLALLIAHTLFLLRTYALYARARFVLYLLSPLIVIEACLAIGGALTGNPISVTDEPSACFPASPRHSLGFVVWGVALGYDSIIFILTVVQSLRVRKTTARPLVSLLFRDGILYYAIVLGVYAINIGVHVVSESAMHDIVASFAGMITMIVTQHLILNLRGLITAAPESTPGPKSAIVTTLDSLVCALGGPLDSWDSDDRVVEAIVLRRLDRQGDGDWIDEELYDGL